jgi:glutaredoxin
MNAMRHEYTQKNALAGLMGASMLASLLAAPALAQDIYRNVGPDGKTSFSDQPAPASSASGRAAVSGAPAASPGPSAQLPFELRQVSSRFPVTLYSSRDCAPCNSGRNLLNARGIPYMERTVESAQDSDALKRLSGDLSLPMLTIGAQQIKGYSDTDWTKFLDAAGYPKQSALPASYRRPAASPLVEVKAGDAAAPSAAQSRPAASAPAQVPVAPPAQNPAGIRF